MKKMLFATLMSLSICSLNAYSPYLNTQTNVDACAVDCCSSGRGISVNADFLWWDTRGEGLSTADRPSLSANDFVSDVSNYPFDYEWKPGYRIELGYVTCLGGYEVDLFAKWTWFRTNYSNTIAIDAPATIGSTIRDPIIVIFALQNQDVLYNVSTSFLYERLDIGLMSNAFELGCFTFKPSAAVTFAYLQDAYTGDAERDGSPARSTGDAKGKFSGAGITIGANVVYPIKCNAFLYSNTELTGLWGEVKVDAVTTRIDSIVIPVLVTERYKESFWAGRLIFEQEIGIGYSTSVKTFPVNAHLGWQFLYLPNFTMLTLASRFNDRTINGLVAGVTIGF
jgi:hypothetical protein